MMETMYRLQISSKVTRKGTRKIKNPITKRLWGELLTRIELFLL